MRPCRTIIAIGLIFSASAVQAQSDRDLCTDRPGLGTPPCTVQAGRTVAELGLVDWTRDSDTSQRTDTLVAGDLLVRIGLSDSIEAQAGWTAFGHQRRRDRATGAISRSDGVGDVFVALRTNLRNPDGRGTSSAVMPYATVPTGGQAICAGDWSAGLLLPTSFDLGGVALELTPQVEAAVDEDRSGRHPLYGAVAGLTLDLADQLSATAELSLHRDDDPGGAATEALTGLSLAWQPNADIQWDAGVNLGLDHDSPDIQLYAGIVRRF